MGDAVRTICMSAEDLAQRVAERHARLMSADPQYREAAPLARVGALKQDGALRLAPFVAAVMQEYADRPALGSRATSIATDAASGRRSLQLLDRFDTLTYGELHSRVRALATVWSMDGPARVGAGDLVCILGFAGVGYVVCDLAGIHRGAVTVPLQTNAPAPQLAAILAQTQPRCLAAGAEYLDVAVGMVLSGYAPPSLLVFDYCAQDDGHRETFERARARLAAAGVATRVETLEAACERAGSLPAPPPFAAPAADDPLATIYYTSGSTGVPKGAMYGERMTAMPWRAPDGMPVISLNYMPMNHSFGRSLVGRTLGSGGTCYFTARSDLSALFDDLRLVRPTQLNLVPRICETVQQHYQRELDALGPGADPGAAMDAVRERLLGGRLLNCPFGSAPMAEELHAFIERCLQVPISNNYGATEVSGVSVNTRISRPPVIAYKLVDVPELGYFTTDKPYPRGELLVKTRTIMQGYFKQPQATAAVFDEEGYYRTGDVMAEIAPDRIVYVDRRNNVQKLAQGEFVAIANVEAALVSASPLIHQVYLYGSSERAFLLAVIVPERAALAQADVEPDDEGAVRAALRHSIQEVARAKELNAYEVPREFLIEWEPFTVENGLLTGIGKPRRPELKARYGARLEAVYARMAASQAEELHALRLGGRDAPLLETVSRAVQATLSIEAVDLNQAISFAELGGDSLSALSLSLLLEEIYGLEVPVGVITHPAGSLRKLAAWIEQALGPGSSRATFASVHGARATEVEASDLVLERFLDTETLTQAARLPAADRGPPRTVLVTGANGYLGRFLMLECLQRSVEGGGRVVCIVRGADAAEARRRVEEAIDSGDEALRSRFAALAQGRLEVMAGDLAERNLGLDEVAWRGLAETIDMIVHPAALVNHVLPYGQLFGPNVVGTAELIRLALTGRRKRFVNVSTVAVAHDEQGRLLDEDADVRLAAPRRSLGSDRYAAGYATSKWAAEVLLREAHDRFGLAAATFRSDMILAHRSYGGQLNIPDMFTRWLYSLAVTGLAPRSFYRMPEDGSPVRAHYDGLPVDFTAAAIVAIGTRATADAGAPGGYRTFHVLNPHDDAISMDTFVDWIAEAGVPVRRIGDYADWVARFETALRALPEKKRQPSFLPLLHQLRSPMRPVRGSDVSARRFRDAVRESGVGADRDIPHVTRELIVKTLRDLKQVGLLERDGA
jgi:fatty acid CoA ligase FadD9